MQTLARFALFSLLFVTILSVNDAQTTTPDPTPPVPDVAGLTVPEAAAKLNQAGLQLGLIEDVQGTAGQANTIAAQVPSAGSAAEPGTAVDLTVRRSQMVKLIYDDNDLTLMNLSSEDLSLRRVYFRSVDGTASTSFVATDWDANRLRGNQCMQLWSIATRVTRAVEGCGSFQKWVYRTVGTAHFWTGANNTTRFEVTQDGVLRGICVIEDGECSLYIAPFAGRSGIAPDVAEYVTLLYTPDTLWITNRTANRWLPTGDLLIGGTQAGDTAIYSTVSDVATPQLLAPGQCLRWERPGAAGNSDADPCEVVGVARVSGFWTQVFRVSSQVDGARRECPPVAEGSQTALCLLPRLAEPE